MSRVTTTGVGLVKLLKGWAKTQGGWNYCLKKYGSEEGICEAYFRELLLESARKTAEKYPEDENCYEALKANIENASFKFNYR